MQNPYQYFNIDLGINRHPILGIPIPEPLSGITMPRQASTSPSPQNYAAQASPQPNIAFTQATVSIVQNNCVKSYIGRSGEDRHVTAILNEFIQMYGVFDGHAGKEVSEYLLNNLPQALSHFLLNINFTDEVAVKNAITNAYIELDKKMLEQQLKSGSTAVVVLYSLGVLYLINLGDSRSILFTNEGKILYETRDHKPNDEKQRIELAGGFVSNGEPPRVNGFLAVSRAFGDFYFKSLPKYNPRGPISVIPDITRINITGTPEINQKYLLLASDGLYDAFTSQNAVDSIIRLGKNIIACEEIINIARKETTDDITVMIVRL